MTIMLLWHVQTFVCNLMTRKWILTKYKNPAGLNCRWKNTSEIVPCWIFKGIGVGECDECDHWWVSPGVVVLCMVLCDTLWSPTLSLTITYWCWGMWWVWSLMGVPWGGGTLHGSLWHTMISNIVTDNYILVLGNVMSVIIDGCPLGWWYSAWFFVTHYSEVLNKHTVSTINFGLSFHPVWSLFRTVLQLILLIQAWLFLQTLVYCLSWNVLTGNNWSFLKTI